MNIVGNDKKAKKQFLLLKTLFILSGLLQGISVALTIPLFRYLFSSNEEKVFFYLILIGAAALLCFASHFAGVNIGNRMSVWEVCDTQIHRVGNAIIKLPLGWFDASSKGKVSKAISTDINVISHYPPIVLPEILTVVASSSVIVVSLLFISWKYALIFLIMGLLLLYFWRKNIRALSLEEKENTRANQKMESTVVEFAQLQPVLRASGALLHGWRRMNTALNDDKKATIKTLKAKGKNTSKYTLAINFCGILILLWSAVELNNHTISIATFVGIVVAMIRLIHPLASLLPYGAEVFNIHSALKRINSIVNTKKLPEPEQEVSIEDKKSGDYDIQFKNVDFSYIPGTPVLKDINLSVPAGSITALVGPSGSGKSTINRLIARFWDVDRGSITIGGKDIRQMKDETLMGLISMVFQEVYLFNTTIKENVIIAKPHATEKELLEAAKKARLDEVIEKLPHGWDTKVGEGGSSLSGGEKQRVSIARAFLKDAPILLLDEITSALDATNEAMITQSLEELSKNRTVIVIAHRLSSIKNAHSIAVIDRGEISGHGSHEQLLQDNEKYSKLWTALVGSEDWQMTT